MNANKWESQLYDFKIWQAQFDRSEWGMEPQTYNAYYNPFQTMRYAFPGCNIIVPGYERKKWLMTPFSIQLSELLSGMKLPHGFGRSGL